MDDPLTPEKDEATRVFQQALMEYFAGLQQRIVEAIRDANTTAG